MWELDGWDGLAANFEHEFSHATLQDPSLAAWWAQAAEFRRRRLRPHPRARAVDPTRSTSADRGGRARRGVRPRARRTSRPAPPATTSTPSTTWVATRRSSRSGSTLIGAFRTAMWRRHRVHRDLGDPRLVDLGGVRGRRSTTTGSRRGAIAQRTLDVDCHRARLMVEAPLEPAAARPPTRRVGDRRRQLRREDRSGARTAHLTSASGRCQDPAVPGALDGRARARPVVGDRRPARRAAARRAGRRRDQGRAARRRPVPRATAATRCGTGRAARSRVDLKHPDGRRRVPQARGRRRRGRRDVPARRDRPARHRLRRAARAQPAARLLLVPRVSRGPPARADGPATTRSCRRAAASSGSSRAGGSARSSCTCRCRAWARCSSCRPASSPR